MRIVNRKEFLELPNNTVYSKYESSGMIDGLHIKDESYTNDWVYFDLICNIKASSDGELLDKMYKAENDHAFQIRNNLYCCQRDGFYEKDDMFVIYNNEDIKALICRLNEVLNKVEEIRETIGEG